MRRRNPSSASWSSIRRRSNTHNVQTKAQPTAISDAPLAELVDVVVESRRRAKGLRIGARELEEHFGDHHA
jgi:hypothetical protein